MRETRTIAIELGGLTRVEQIKKGSSMKQEGFQRLLMKECEKEGGILPWSKKHGIPFSTVRHAIKGRLPTEPICKVLGYRYEARFVKIKGEAQV